MARLIPRKQIEEQQNITGSLEIGQDLFVGNNSFVANDSIISGSLDVKQNFFLGDQLTDRGEITGSVFLTGSLEVDGELIFAGPSAVLSATASQALLAQDTLRYEGRRARDFGANIPTLYVSSTDGDDINDGRTIQFPLRTIKRAAQLSQPGYDGRYGFDTGSIFNGYVIKVQAGTYLEDNPVILPSNTTIWGAGLRITKINAKNPTEDLFWVNSGCYVAEVTMGGLRLFPDQINPERGFAIAYQPGAFITTSPYIQNCSHISNQENSFTELYEDIPPGGGGLYVNGDAVDPNSPLASMVLDAYTQISPNGVGCLVNGRGFIQLVSFFTNFSYYAIRVNNGGHATLNNSNISFGLFGMYASGSRFISGSGGNIDARNSVRETWSCVVDVLNKGLEAGLPSKTKLNTDEGIRLSPPSIFPQYTTSSNVELSKTAADEISSDFKLISEIVDKGTSDFPTLLAISSNKGYGFDSPYNILGAPQITSSISSASLADLTSVSESYRVLLSIFADGTGSYKLTSSADLGVAVTNTSLLPLGTPSYLSGSVSSSFETVINILKGNKITVTSGTSTQEITNYLGETSYLTVTNTLSLSTLPSITSSNSASIYVGGIEPFTTGLSSSLSVRNKLTSSFSIISNILQRGTGSVILPIPQNHQKSFVVRKSDDNTKYTFNVSGSGVSNTIPPVTSSVFNVTNNGSGNYVINGQSNPTLNLIEGQTYTFNINASGHPFWIKTNISLGTGNAYNTGVTNNGTDNGTITFVVPIGAPILYYNCQFHSSMAGTLNTLNSNTVPPSASINTIDLVYENPTLTLFRGETYRFFVNAGLGPDSEPFFIRKKPISGFDYQNIYNYDIGVVNNGDSFGTITFSVPYDAPNELYYISQDTPSFVGKFHIINNSETPFDLISNTLTYPKIISGSNVSTENVDILNAYEILTGSKSFIQEEVVQFVSSSWSTFDYTESIFRSNIGFVINAVCEDLLYGGNINSVNAGKFYYEYVSDKTIVEKDASITAIKYTSGLANNLVKNTTFTDIDAQTYNSDRKTVAENLFTNREFIQNETIAFLSSSWSNFYYNEEKCKRDTGYIIDAVITDLKYGGNERAVIAGKFYYDYPSLAIVEGDGDGEGQLGQTLDGIRYAAALATNIVKNKTFNSPTASTQAAYDLLRGNKSLIQNETVQFINVAFPQLKYNQATCKRDVGYIIDAISTDLLYGGNERAVTAGRYYYDYPSLATSVQRKETTAGIKYSKAVGDFVIQNLILDTPRIISNDEKNIRVSNVNNTTSSFSGSITEQLLVSSSFGIIKNIVLRGLGAIQSALALDTGLGWSKTNPFNISNGVQIINVGSGSYVSSSLNGFNIVTNIINSGSSVAPTIVSNTLAGIKATTELQYTASNSASNSDRSIVSSSFGNIINIVTNGTGSIPNTTLNTNRGVKVTNILQITSSITPSGFEGGKVTNGFNLVLDIIENGTGSLPTIIQNASNLVKRTNSTQFVSTASISQTYITASKNGFNLISDIVEYGTGSLPALVRNVEDLVRITDTVRYSSSYAISSSNVDSITSKFDTVISILENGTGSLPNIILNTSQSIKVTSANQYISASSATNAESIILSASIAIVTNILVNGTGSAIVSASLSLPTSSYVAVTSSSNKLLAYEILKNNLDFIVSESIAYLSSSWSTASYDETKCRRDLKGILSGSAEDLIFNSNSASVFNGIFYYQFPSQAQGAQLNQTLDVINYASKLAQKVILNTPFVLPTSQSLVSRDILVNNKLFIQNETISYLSSSWSSHSYSEGTCKRDIGHIIDAVATDTIYGGNERTVNAGVFYYLYPSAATGSQIEETVTGINYSKNLADKLLRGNQFIKVAQNKLQARELITRNKGFIQNEVISYVSASWSEFLYNQETCKRDIGFILDAIATDVVYGGNERSLEAGEYYYRYPSEATTTQLGPTLAGIEHSKGLVNEILQNKVFILPTTSAQTAFNLINNNKRFIQSESIAYVSSSWSFFEYDDIKCARDIGYILDAVATDTLYGGNERTAKAGEYYYLYPSLAIIEGDGDGTGQLGQTLDGINYAKGITQKVVSNFLLQPPTQSELDGYDLLFKNKKLIQSESIAYLDSAWSIFEYNKTTCRRDLSYIIDAVATDLKYGGNQRTNKAGEYYYLYPSLAVVANTTTGQLEQTVDGIRFAAGISNKIVNNTQLIQQPQASVSASVSLIRQNRGFIQNETVEYIDAFYPYLIYNREKCRRDTGYILDAVITDLFYGGNERSVIAGRYYYEYPSLAITNAQKKETVNGIEYAKSVTELVAQNIKLTAPILQLNTDDNIKVTNTTQYSSSLSGSITEVSKVNSSFEIVTDIIEAGVKSFTPTNATYNPANGDFVITIPNHKLKAYNFIYLRQKSFVFTCTMDGNRTEHALPGVGQYPYSNKLEIQSVTQNTITVNVGKSGPNVEFTPTSASYNPATGEFVVTVGPHNLSIGEGIVLSTGSFAFTCDMDNNHSTKSYPRFGIDPYSVRSIPITAITNDTLTFNVGISAPNKFFTPTSASYNALTGDMILTVGQHGLGVGRSVTLASASIAFTCDQDNNQTTHSYPRSGSDPYAGKSIEIISVGASTHTVQNAPYDALTGITTLTINNHGFSNGDYIKISNNSLTYTCVLDENEVLKSYPRPGYDYPSGRWLEISNVTTNTFTIDIGPSSYVDSHTFITASLNGLERQTGTFTINVGDGGSASGSIHTFVSASANAVRHLPQSVHTFVSASAGAIKHYPQAAHTFVRTTRNSVSTLPIIVSNVESLIKVTNVEQFTASISASGVEVDIVTSSFKLIRDIIYNGSSSVPDSLAANFNYGFELKPPTNLHITSINQILGSGSYDIQTGSVSSSFGTIINIVKKGVSVSPPLSTNTSASLKRTEVSQYSGSVSASTYQLNRITSGYNIILDIVENGYSVVPTLITNTSSSIKVTDSPQLISGSSADRLQGKLISASFGLVIDILLNGTGSAPSMVSGSGPNPNPKINAAYNLLLGNKSFIVSESIAYLSSSWSTFEYNQQSCSRDLSGIIDGAAIDLLYGGNSASLFNGKFYYQFPSQASGTGSQVQQTVTVLRYASQIAEKVVRNTLLTHITASAFEQTSASYVSLTKNKAFIQSESIAYLSSSWKGFDYNEVTCKRDIGYVIDAVATDLLYGGNERAIIAGNYYYDYPSLAVTTQLEPTLTGIRFGKGTALNVVVNKQYFTASADVSSSYTLLVDNRNYIQSESVAFVNAKYPNLEYSESKCLRDVGFIVDAVATDLLYGGNERSRKAGLFYNQYPSEANGTGSQIIETTAAIEYASRLSTQIINSVLIPTPQPIPNGTASIDPNVLATYNLLINNKGFIQSESLQYLSSSWSTATYNQQSRSLDLGYIVDAVANDLLLGGNESSVNIAVAYLLTASLDTIEKMESNVTTIDYAKGLASKLVQSKVFVTASQNISASVNLLRLNREFIQDETLAYLTASWSTFEYDKVKCKRDTGYIVDSVTTDLLYGGNERSVEAGDLYYRYPSLAVLEGDGDGTGQLGQTVDGLNYASRLAQKVVKNITFVTASSQASASFDLLRKNKSFIQNEVIAYVSSSWSGVYYNEVTCKRDVGYLIDAAATDVLYGGQERSVIAGSYYYLYPSRATNKGVPSEQNQLDPTLTGIRWAGRLAKKVIVNPIFELQSASLVSTVDLLKFNKTLIQKETITFISSSWTSLNYNEASCSRDLGFILDAIRTDLIYGGNERSIEAGSYYYKYPSVAIYESYNSFGDFGQKKQTVEGINFARGISERIVANRLLTYLAPSTKRRQAADRLRAGKTELKQKALGYTNGAFPYLVYNEASCSRDTGLIVDACVTDLLYGGNERGIAAASSYYNGQFGNGDEVIFKQRIETLEANRYLRTKAEFIVAGAPLESFGSLIVATGIDYSYNGSGVTFKALPPNQGGTGVPNPAFEITELGGGRIFFTSGNQDGDFRIGTGLSINQATGTLVGRTFSKSLFSLVTPFSLALEG